MNKAVEDKVGKGKMVVDKAIEGEPARKTLRSRCTIRVRFSEVDSLGMVWHGNYVKYLEDAREAFGRQHGLEYLYVYSSGYITPVVELNIRYHAPARVNDVLEVEVSYIPSRGAKMMYEYTIRNSRDGTLVLTASSLQLYQATDGTLELSKPDFIRKWEREKGV